MMIDLHIHSILSDGELLPAEIARRFKVNGFDRIAICDHADSSNLDFVVSRIKNICDEFKKLEGICLFPGVELTHVPPSLILDLVERSRRLGAKVVIVHGETIVEPVEPGTNCAALLSDIDILAHPGLITEQEMKIANQRGICLEITSRKGHSLTNGHVASLAKAVGAKLVLNTDTHIPEDIITKDLAIKIIQSCGLEREDFEYMMKNALQILDKRDLKV